MTTPANPIFSRPQIKHVAEVIAALPDRLSRDEVAEAFRAALLPTNCGFNPKIFAYLCGGSSPPSRLIVTARGIRHA